MTGRGGSLTLGLVAGVVISLVFVFGFVAGALVDRGVTASATGTSDPNLRDFVSAYHLLTQESYYRPFNKHQLVYAAIDGMLSATGDPHTIFLSPPENRTANQALNGSGFSGIGAIVVPDHGSLQVLAPLPGSPAAESGLRAGDSIVRINGKKVSALSGDQAIGRIHGRVGTAVKLTVIHRHARAVVISVKRRAIAPITAYGRVLPDHLGYTEIFSYGSTTGDEVRRALTLLRKSHVRGIVLDLRGNPGGYVEAAQRVVSLFLSHGVVAYEEQRNTKALAPLNVIPGQRVVNVPVDIMVDSQTASAAEITAAALRDEDRAVIIGSRTYGKGSMQSVYSLADGSTVRITDRLWLTPRKHSINGVGLAPTISIAPSPASVPLELDTQLHVAENYLLHHAR